MADKAGVKLPVYGTGTQVDQDEKELLLRINNFAARYYHEILIKDGRGKQALEYLKSRGLNEATIKQWQIGFAPDDYHALEKALLAKKVSLDDSIKAGVMAKNERGQTYDRFRGRITFPIYNYFGETVGFSARILNDDGKSAKYVNSPETIIYNKSKTLFGLNFAKETIRKKDEAVIVEGQMDCIQAHQAGFNNTVASSGTALTEAGLMQLARLTKNLKFCFDSDSAGQAASRRAGEAAMKQGFSLKLIILKAVKDPDELIKKSPGLWEKAVSEAIWFLDYYIGLAEINYAPGSVEQKLYLSKEVVPFLQYVQDPLEQDHYIHKLSSKFLISESVIRQQIKKQNAPAVTAAPTNTAQGSLLLQKEILGGLLVLPDFASEVKVKIEKQDFEDSAIAQIIELWLNANPEAGHDAVAKEAVFMVESQLEDMQGDAEKLKKSLDKSFALFKLSALKRTQQNLQAQIKAAEVKGDKAALEELNKKFIFTTSLRAEFENRI